MALMCLLVAQYVINKLHQIKTRYEHEGRKVYMRRISILRVCLIGVLFGACQAQQASTPEANFSLQLPPGSQPGILSISQDKRVTLPAPKRQPGYRMSMLFAQGTVRGPIFKAMLKGQPNGNSALSYTFKTAPQGKDRWLEVFLFDGKEYDLVGRNRGNAVQGTSLDLRYLPKESSAGLYFFALSFTQAQYLQACKAAGGRFNGAYCGPK
jgi:hypothetical protein